MMDQPKKEQKTVTIWDKFESTAPGIPDWIRNKDQTGMILQALLKTLPAQSILISTSSEIFLTAGNPSEETQQRVLQILEAFWDPIQKSDLTRYMKDAQGSVVGFIFSASLFQNLILTLHYQEAPTLSTAIAHTKRIIRALSGKTVAAYEAKTIPVDAAVAAQMRKFFEQNVQQVRMDEDPSQAELPLPKPSVSPAAGLEQVEQTTEPSGMQEEDHTLDALMPSMEELLGEHKEEPATLEELKAAGANDTTIQVTQDTEISAGPPAQFTDSNPQEKISAEDLARLEDELDDFFQDDELSEADLQEQKEKLAAILQELPSPDPEKAPAAEQLSDTIPMEALPERDGAPLGFTLPWEDSAAENQEVASDTEMDEPLASVPEETSQPVTSFSELLQQAEQQSEKMLDGPEPDSDEELVERNAPPAPIALPTEPESRGYTVIIIPRIAFHELGAAFEKKFELYLHQISNDLSFTVEEILFFSQHVQIRMSLAAKASIVRTLMQVKKQLADKILHNYATFAEELAGHDLWFPGQLIFNEQEKVDSRRIETFVRSAQS